MSRLGKPHPFIYNSKSIVIPGLIAFLLITTFAPFEFRELALGNRVLFALAFGLLSSLSVVLVVGGTRRLFPQVMQEDNWTVGKEMVLYVSVIATICLVIFVSFVLFGLSSLPTVVILQQVILYTLATSIMPGITLVLYEQYSFQKQNAKEAIQLSISLSAMSASPSPKKQPIDHVLLGAENGKIALRLAYDKILYLKAEGNYVEVFYLDQHNRAHKKLIRNRLKNLLEVLPAHQFFHAHKSYVANGKYIEQVKGNARNFELVLNHSTASIPVSRSKSKELSVFIKSLH